MLDGKLQRDNKQEMCDLLELNEVLDRQPSQLSGGELQRFAIAISCIQKADVYVMRIRPCARRSNFRLGICLMSHRVIWTSNNVCKLRALSVPYLIQLVTSLPWNTIYPFWIIFPISFAVCTARHRCTGS